MSDTTTSFSLHYGQSSKPLVRVVPDDKWPGMWRIAWPDGSLSDMVNLARAKDAAMFVVGKGLAGGRQRQNLHWKSNYTHGAGGAPPIAQNGQGHP